jgi:hypothetical protein
MTFSIRKNFAISGGLAASQIVEYKDCEVTMVTVHVLCVLAYLMLAIAHGALLLLR